MQFTPVLALYDPFGVDVPLNLDNTHSPNVNMANMMAAAGKCANSMASNNIADHTLEVCNKLTVTGGKLEGAVEKLNIACTREQPPRGAPWVSGLVGHFVHTWPDSECSHTVQCLDRSDLN